MALDQIALTSTHTEKSMVKSVPFMHGLDNSLGFAILVDTGISYKERFYCLWEWPETPLKNPGYAPAIVDRNSSGC